MNLKEINTKITEHPLLTIGLMTLAFLCLGLLLGSQLMPIKVTKTEYITLPQEVVTVEVVKYETVEVPVQVPVIVREKEIIVQEVIVGNYITVPMEPKPFESKEALVDWLANSKSYLKLFKDEGAAACVDHSYSLMLTAIKDGYILDTELINDNTHAICKAPVFSEKKIYLIDWETKEITGYVIIL